MDADTAGDALIDQKLKDGAVSSADVSERRNSTDGNLLEKGKRRASIDMKEMRKELLETDDGTMPDLVKRQQELKESKIASLSYYEQKINAVDGGTRAAKAAEEEAKKKREPKIYGPPRWNPFENGYDQTLLSQIVFVVVDILRTSKCFDRNESIR